MAGRTDRLDPPPAAIEPDQLRHAVLTEREHASLRDRERSSPTACSALDLLGDRNRLADHTKAVGIKGPCKEPVTEHVEQVARRRIDNLRVAVEQSDAIAGSERPQVSDVVMIRLFAPGEKQEGASPGMNEGKTCAVSPADASSAVSGVGGPPSTRICWITPL